MTSGDLRTVSGLPSAIFRPKFRTLIRSEIAITRSMRHADCKIVRMMAIETYHDVFDRAHFAEQLGVLERSCNSQPPNRMGSAAIDPFAFERDRSAIDRVEAGDDVEHRTLARAVWPDHGLDRSPVSYT